MHSPQRFPHFLLLIEVRQIRLQRRTTLGCAALLENSWGLRRRPKVGGIINAFIEKCNATFLPMRQLSVRIALGNAAEKGLGPRGECKWKWERVVWVFPPPHQLFVSFSAFTLFFPFLLLAISRALSLKVTPTRFPPKQQATPPLQAVRHFSFVPWASHRVVFCCVVCVIYVTRNANTWVNMQNISQTMIWADTHICTRPLSVLHTNTSIHISVCVCANGKFGDCLQTRYVRAPNAASTAFTFLK